MWDNFIGKQIRRCNRNLLLANLVLLGAVITYAAANSRYLGNFLSGPTDISNMDLAELRNPAERFRFLVHVRGEQSFETGIQFVEQTIDKYSNNVQSTTVKAEYRILAVGHKLLVVKTAPSASGTTFTGALVSMPPTVYEKVVAASIREEPQLQGMFVPAMLDTEDYADEGWWTLCIGIPLLILVAWNLLKWKKRVCDYSCHPIYRRIACFGSAEQVIQQMEADMRTNPVQKLAGANIFGPWLLKNKFFGLACFHLPDLIWIYQKVTKHSINFIPTGKSFAALLYDRYGYSTEIQAGKKKVELFMTHIIQQCPWIAAGFSKDLENLWKSQRGVFIAAVDERRKKVPKAAGARTGK